MGDRGLGEPVPTPGQIPAEVARDGRTARQHRVRRLRRAGPFPERAGGPSSSHWGLCRTPHKRTKERGKRGWRGSRRVTAGGGRRLRSVTKPQVRAPARPGLGVGRPSRTGPAPSLQERAWRISSEDAGRLRDERKRPSHHRNVEKKVKSNKEKRRKPEESRDNRNTRNTPRVAAPSPWREEQREVVTCRVGTRSVVVVLSAHSENPGARSAPPRG